MSDIALRTVGLGKMYRIGGEREKYRTLRDTLVQAAKRPIERMRHPGAATHASEEIWALRHIDLEVKRGEVLGIIGRNGAGKSTLLKVLSHITEPTEGRVEIRGRVASLLEVGTGFHGELTGRENIQLNGAILGMTRAEIKSKFDDIVEFSEIGRFLDTPVKRYSSGMYVRLAFAVAAHLDPEILIVDEVLAVGDAEFQRKCLGKMNDVAHGGRTVVFVSHNMAVVSRLCPRTVLLRDGEVVRSGETPLVVSEYLNELTSVSGEVTWLGDDAPGRGSALRYRAARLVGPDGAITAVVDLHSGFSLEFEYEILSELQGAWIGYHLVSESGEVVFATGETSLDEDVRSVRLPGRYLARCAIPRDLLNDGVYGVKIVAYVPGLQFLVNNGPVLSFETIGRTSPGGYGKYPGQVRPKLEWEVIGPSEATSTGIGQDEGRSVTPEVGVSDLVGGGSYGA